MSEFSARNKKSEFADWSVEKHKRVYRRVRQITKKYGIRTASFSVYKKDYDEVVPADMRQNAGLFHYTWAVRSLLTYLQRWRGSHSPLPLEYVFDFMNPKDARRKEIEEVMEQAEYVAIKDGHPGEFKNYSFRERCSIPGLQCVDMLGWVSFRYALLVFCKKPLVPDARTGWNDFENHPDKEWRHSLAIRRSELERWVAAEREEGKSAKWFEEWRNKKPEKKAKNAKIRSLRNSMRPFAKFFLSHTMN